MIEITHKKIRLLFFNSMCLQLMVPSLIECSEKALHQAQKETIAAQSPSSKAIAYLKSLPAPFTFNGDTYFAHNMIAQGTTILSNLYGGTFDILKTSTNNQLTIILSIMWALYEKAVQKNQGFTSGTFVISDKNYTLYNFLYSYVERVNSAVKEGATLCSYLSPNPYAYKRVSSHFPELQILPKSPGQYGIDIRYNKNSKVEFLLPTNKSHILFGKLLVSDKDHLIFIKLETHGLHKAAFVDHTSEFFEKILGKREIGHSRREDIVTAIKDAFLKFLEILDKPAQQAIKKYIKVHHGYYIKNMYTKALELTHSHNKKVSQEALNFISLLKSYDHLNLRRGNEVIFTTDELIK